MTSQVDEFAKVAARFCLWAESESQPPEREAQVAHQLLCDLYQLALQLPPEFAEADPSEVSDESWKRVYRRFGALPFNYYSHCFDPQEIPTEAAAVASDSWWKFS